MAMLTVVPNPTAEPAPLDRTHPVAAAAHRDCLTVHPALTRRGRLDGVACPPCFAEAIRTDALFAAVCELPFTAPAPDPVYVDPVAVERACTGERVPLTPAEQVAATRALLDDGWGPSWIARWLHVGWDTVTDLITAARTLDTEPPEAVAA